MSIPLKLFIDCDKSHDKSPLYPEVARYKDNYFPGMLCIVPPPGREDFCHVGAATKPKSQRSKSSCVPNVPFELMNRRFDLKNSFFSSTEISSGTRNGIHWEEYSSARVLTWFYGDVLA